MYTRCEIQIGWHKILPFEEKMDKTYKASTNSLWYKTQYNGTLHDHVK